MKRFTCRPRLRSIAAPRGFSIIECISVLGLLAVFILLESHLFMQTSQLITSSNSATERANRFDGILRHLRQDVWLSERIVPGDTPGAVVLFHPGERRIHWSWAGDDAVIDRTLWEGGMPTREQQWQDPFPASGPKLFAQPHGVELFRRNERGDAHPLFLLSPTLLLPPAPLTSEPLP